LYLFMTTQTHLNTNELKTKSTTANRRLAKKRFQWLNEHSTSHQLLWYVDSLVLRNPLLRKAANR
jgi:tRNA A37 N6-isopentenylltransferase MiaA